MQLISPTSVQDAWRYKQQRPKSVQIVPDNVTSQKTGVYFSDNIFFFFICLNSYTCYSIYEVNFPEPIRYPDMTKRSTLIKQGTHDPPTLNAHNVVPYLRPLVLEFSHAQIMFTPVGFVEDKVLWFKLFSVCSPVDFKFTNVFFLSTYLIKYSKGQSGRQIIIFY
jgi:hypothetical protein